MLDSERPSTRSWAAITTESTSSMPRRASSRARRTVEKISSVRSRRASAQPISRATPSTKVMTRRSVDELRQDPFAHEPQGTEDVVVGHVAELRADDDLVGADGPVGFDHVDDGLGPADEGHAVVDEVVELLPCADGRGVLGGLGVPLVTR